MSKTESALSQCPPERVWDELVAGLIRGERAEILAEHASTCSDCASLLRDSIAVLAPPEEDSKPPVQVLNVSSTKPSRAYSRAWMGAAAALVVILGASYWYYFQRRSQSPLEQLAAAYSSDRTVELRIPGAIHGPLRTERGSPSSSLINQPSILLEVAARIKRELARNPRDPLWLHARGRLEILEWRPEEAIETLQAARDWGGSSSALLIDLAVAYYQRGIRGNDSADLNEALDLLGRVIQSAPTAPEALFNRALVEEKLNQITPAITDLEKLVSIETSGPWNQEARSILDRLRKKRTAFFERPAEQDQNRFDEVLLDTALQSWLGRTDSAGYAALAERFDVQHADQWLVSLASVRKSPFFAQTISILQTMAAIRLSTERGRYQTENVAFETIVYLPLPTPLAAWRDFESLYRATHARGEFHCPESKQDLPGRLQRLHYSWLAVQAFREQAYCSFQAGDLESAEAYAQRSIEEARSHSFPISAVRSEAVLDHVAIRRGRFRAAINQANATLDNIIELRMPVARSHEFHNIIMVSSQSLNLWHSARSSAMTMTETARLAGLRDLEFTNTIAWAQMTLRCGDAVEAGTLFQHAMGLYSSISPSNDRAWAGIGFADATGDESRLDEFAKDLDDSPDPMLWIPYQRVRAQLAVSTGHFMASALGRSDPGLLCKSDPGRQSVAEATSRPAEQSGARR